MALVDFHFIAIGLAFVALALIIAGSRFAFAHAVGRIYGRMLFKIGANTSMDDFSANLDTAREGARWLQASHAETLAWGVVIVVMVFLIGIYHAGTGFISRRLSVL